MFYMLVPDPTGVVNQNVRSVDFVKGVTLGTLAHEFQHLINSSRHLYTNASGVFEDVFLDEGLAHEAEELVFFRASGLTHGQNIAYESLQSPSPVSDAFNAFAAPNFRRLREFLLSPNGNSPYAGNANLATRGAIWSFLRYAADRRGGDESQLWFQLANPPAGGARRSQPQSRHNERPRHLGSRLEHGQLHRRFRRRGFAPSILIRAGTSARSSPA